MSSSDSDGGEGEQQQQPQLLGSGKARAPNRHRFKNLAERIDEVRLLSGFGVTAAWLTKQLQVPTHEHPHPHNGALTTPAHAVALPACTLHTGRCGCLQARG